MSVWEFRLLRSDGSYVQAEGYEQMTAPVGDLELRLQYPRAGEDIGDIARVCGRVVGKSITADVPLVLPCRIRAGDALRLDIKLSALEVE